MTKTEKDMCQNPDWICFEKMTAAQRAIIAKTPENKLQYLNMDGTWRSWVNPSLAPTSTRAGIIYRINPEAEVEPPPYTEYTVFKGDSTIGMTWLYGAQFPLNAAPAHARYAGIRYKNDTFWRSTLDTIEFGEPVAVRFYN